MPLGCAAQFPVEVALARVEQMLLKLHLQEVSCDGPMAGPKCFLCQANSCAGVLAEAFFIKRRPRGPWQTFFCAAKEPGVRFGG